jgi:hypothetical protein
VTETGWPTTAVNHKTQCLVSPLVQAQYLKYILTSAADSHIIQHVFWYTIGNNDGMSITQNGGPLPGFYTLKAFIQQRPTWNK